MRSSSLSVALPEFHLVEHEMLSEDEVIHGEAGDEREEIGEEFRVILRFIADLHVDFPLELLF